MTSFSILLGVELKKRWRLNMIILLGSITIVLCGIAWLIAIASDKAKISTFNFNQYLDVLLVIVVPFWVIFTTGGIIRFDIKDHWLRTILSRSIKREIYLSVKIVEALIGLAAGIIFLGIIPVIVYSLASGLKVENEFSGTLVVLLNRILSGAVYISISIFFSCWLPSYINAVILAGWMFLDAFVVQVILTNFAFTNKILGVLSDFFFPSGFGDATGIILNKGAFPFEEYLWGLAALFFFAGLAFFLINKVKLDSSAD